MKQNKQKEDQMHGSYVVQELSSKQDI